MEYLKQILPDLIPLFQSLLWFVFIGVLVVYFRKDILLLRSELQRRLEAGDAVVIGPFQLLERKVEKVEKEVSITKQFLFSMGSAMYFNLKKIASGHFGPYEVGQRSGLQRELYYLRDIGYIEIDSISKLPPKGDNLSDYVRITEVGRKFVELREGVSSSEFKL